MFIEHIVLQRVECFFFGSKPRKRKKKKEKRVISCRSLQVCNLGLSIGAYLYVNSLQMLTNAVFLSVIRMQIVRIPKAHFVVSV